MRIVLDTSILVAALLKKGTAYRLLQYALKSDRFDIVSASKQMEELKSVLNKKFPNVLQKSEVGTFINLFTQAAIMVRPQRVNLSPDPDDNIILGIALAGKAEYLITTDKAHLLALKNAQKTKIVHLSAFMKQVSRYGR